MDNLPVKRYVTEYWCGDCNKELIRFKDDPELSSSYMCTTCTTVFSLSGSRVETSYMKDGTMRHRYTMRRKR